MYRETVSGRVKRGTARGLLELPKVRPEIALRSFAFRALSAWNVSLATHTCHYFIPLYFPFSSYYFIPLCHYFIRVFYVFTIVA